MRQTTVQDSKTIRFGSAEFEVGEDVNSLVNLGAMRDIQFEETWDMIKVMSDNAGEVNIGIRNHVAALEGNLMEINLNNLEKIRGGLDNFEVVAGTPVAVEDERIALNSSNSKRLANKNGNNTEVADIVVTNLAGSTTYVRNTDYVIAVDAQGFTTIARVAGGDITSGQEVLVSYEYTPNEAKILKTGGKVVLGDRVARITNTNELGKKFSITIFKSQNANGISIDLPGDEDEDPMMTNIRMEGQVDSTRDAGEQLFEIYDEQGA